MWSSRRAFCRRVTPVVGSRARQNFLLEIALEIVVWPWPWFDQQCNGYDEHEDDNKDNCFQCDGRDQGFELVAMNKPVKVGLKILE